MKKIIFIGKSGSGKTTLCQRLNGEMIKYKKTQTIELYVDSIDTPGEYLENRLYYSALITTAADAEIIALIQEVSDIQCKLPPGFAATFGRKVIGIITKIDLLEAKENIPIIKNQLKSAGVSEIFEISSLSNDGIESFQNYLKSK